MRGVRGPEQRDRSPQPGHECAAVSPAVGQSLDWIQFCHGIRLIYSKKVALIYKSERV